MITFNFFEDNATELLEKMSRYLNRNIEDIEDFLMGTSPDKLTPEVLIETFDLNLNEYNSDQIQVIGRHMTTSAPEKLQSFRTYGLLGLKESLLCNTPLKVFLDSQGIELKIDERLIVIDKKIYPILDRDESCRQCYKGRSKVCSNYSHCYFMDEVNKLEAKLRYYQPTLEFFISGTVRQMNRYSSVGRCPEILTNLNAICTELDSSRFPRNELCHEWIKDNPNCYVLEFPIRWSEMLHFEPIGTADYYPDYQVILNGSGYSFEDYKAKRIPKSIFDNIFFLKKIISVLTDKEAEEYGALVFGKQITPDELKIYQRIGAELIPVDDF